jgi:hypothetical protein
LRRVLFSDDSRKLRVVAPHWINEKKRKIERDSLDIPDYFTTPMKRMDLNWRMIRSGKPRKFWELNCLNPILIR